MYRMLIVDDEKNERDCILYLLILPMPKLPYHLVWKIIF